MGKHLTFEQRCQVQALPVHAVREQGLSQALIAVSIGRSQSAVSRKLGCNSGRRGYRCKQAQGKAEGRRSVASCRPRKMTAAAIGLIEGKLRDEPLSPEQVAGWLAAAHQIALSQERIYRHIWPWGDPLAEWH